MIADWLPYGLKVEGETDRIQDNPPASNQLGVAMFEAADAINRRYQPLLDMKQADPSASMEAATATAAHDILVAYFPSKKARSDENAAFALDALNAPASAISAGKAVGAEAARRALTRGTLDPTTTLIEYRPFTLPGTRVPTALPVFENDIQGMQPWTLKSVDRLRLASLPALTSKRWVRDFNEVKSLGGLNSTTRTAHETLMARYRITPDIMPTLRRITGMLRRRTVDNARFFAKVHIVDCDEGSGMIDAKMHDQFWRPITAIRNAHADGKPETLA